jgi:hypothetical protein
MTNLYEVSSVAQIDSIDDMEFSLRRWLHKIETAPVIYLERDKGEFSRPAFRVDIADISSKVITSAFWDSEKKVRIRYQGTSKQNTQQVISKIEFKLQNTRWLIPYVLQDFPYAQPTLRENLAAGTLLTAGTYYVRIQGQSILNEWTLASPTTPITIGLHNSIQVLIPSISPGVPYFKSFRIYVGTASGQEYLLATVSANALTEVTQYTITALPVGTTAPDVASEVYYRYMRVSDIELHMMEDPFALSVWDGLVNFTCCFFNARQALQHVPMTVITHNITPN